MTVGVEHGVVESVVAVHDRRRALVGNELGQPLVHRVDQGDVARLRLLELRVPTAKLPVDVAVATGEVAEPHRVDVDRVDVGQHVDQRLARGPPLQRPERGASRLDVAHDRALDEAHHVERLVVDRLVVAVADRGGHRHGRRPERRDDPELTAHVVGGGQDLSERRPPEHPRVAGLVADPEGQVGPAPRDQAELEWRGDAVDVGLEPRRDRLDGDAFHLVHAIGTESHGLWSGWSP